MVRKRNQRLNHRASKVLHETVSGFASPRPTLDDLVRGLKDRAFGLVLLLFALPNCIPGPPFLGSVFGLPLLFFGIQLAAGRRYPWLPRVIAQYSLDRETLLAIIGRGRPVLERIERICRPRLAVVTGPRSERLLGLAMTILAAAVMIPLPFTNFIPAVGIAVIALGLLEEDGVTILVGLTIGLIGVAIVITVLVGAGALIAGLAG
ncbi:MAG: exopolysaccharide biosynthesis protein [Alphaproteobacteria bacterium]|jgi:hypothetical protein|nr:exopolysaccharide biosynthesis protein [Alphaproteobacteria bacterium]